MKSQSTYITYSQIIKHFFTYKCNKSIQHLTQTDIQIRNADIYQYQAHLLQTGLSHKSVNLYIDCINSLYQFLEINQYPIQAKTLRIESLPEKPTNRGVLTVQQAQQMSQLVLTTPKGYEKSMLIKIAYKTSIRKEALLNLKWTDIKKINDKDYYLIEVYDKGIKRDQKPISREMYQELQQLHQYLYYKKDQYVFHLSINTITNMFKYLRQEMQLEENITFHSLKNVAINWCYEHQGIVAAARQGNHASIQTAYHHYINKNIDYETMFGIASERKEMDDQIINHITIEQFKQIYKHLSASAQNEIKQQYEKINQLP